MFSLIIRTRLTVSSSLLRTFSCRAGEHLFLRLELELHRQRLAQLGRFLRRALLEDLLLVVGDRLDLLEQLVAVFGEEDLLAAQLGGDSSLSVFSFLPKNLSIRAMGGITSDEIRRRESTNARRIRRNGDWLLHAIIRIHDEHS